MEASPTWIWRETTMIKKLRTSRGLFSYYRPRTTNLLFTRAYWMESKGYGIIDLWSLKMADT